MAVLYSYQPDIHESSWRLSAAMTGTSEVAVAAGASFQAASPSMSRSSVGWGRAKVVVAESRVSAVVVVSFMVVT